jgi:hypothetical protein
MILHTTLLADPTELPKESPQTAFGAGASAEDPMRNFGYTVAAYAVLWAILLAFVVLTWRKQAALDARLAQLEGAMSKAQGDRPKGGG